VVEKRGSGGASKDLTPLYETINQIRKRSEEEKNKRRGEKDPRTGSTGGRA